MPAEVNSYAFLSPVPVSHSSVSARLHRKRLSAARPPLHGSNKLAVTMTAPLPDDTALDMISFALSGPGLAAFAAAFAGGAAFIVSFAEIGPRRGASLQRSSFLLRITVPSAAYVELPNGTAKNLPVGETVLRLHSFEACTAVARAMEQPGVSYTIYRAGPTGIRTLSTYPKTIDAKGGAWPREIVEQADEGHPEARWEEYQRLGAIGDIDKEWFGVIDKIAPMQTSDESECKLCGGSKTVRCHRCGGVGRRGGDFVCDCDNGRRRCDWCCESDS